MIIWTPIENLSQEEFDELYTTREEILVIDEYREHYFVQYWQFTCMCHADGWYSGDPFMDDYSKRVAPTHFSRINKL